MRKSRSEKMPSPEEAAAIAAEEERVRRVEVGFLEAVHARLPSHSAVLETLGCLYTEMGRYQDGLRADRQIVEMEPHSPIAWYNLACSLSLTSQVDDAFAALEKALALGYDDADWMQNDDDFIPIRSDPRFDRLLARLLSRKT